MAKLIFDIEGDALYENITRCWCICTKDIVSGVTRKYWMDSDMGGTRGDECDRHGDISDGLLALGSAEQIIGHNIIGFDLPALEKLYGWKLPSTVKVTDTLVLSRLFQPDRKGGHSLGVWGERLGRGKPEYEDWKGGLTPEMLVRCSEDVEINHLVYNELKSEIKGQRWGESIDLEHEVARIIAQQEVNGCLFNSQLADHTLSILASMIDEINRNVSPLLPTYVAGVGTPISKPFKANGELSVRAKTALGEGNHYVAGPFQRYEIKTVDLDSGHQVKKWLSDIGWKPTEFTPKGGPKLTEDSFDTLPDETLGTLLKDRAQIRHRMGQIKGWIESVREDGRITAGANTIGTPTGRMRHSNIVNVPSAATYPKGHELAGHLHWLSDTSIRQSVLAGTEMRAMFCSAPGYDFVGHDASGLELRMLAHYMNDPEYTEVLLNGDIHSHNQELAGLHTRSSAKTFI